MGVPVTTKPQVIYPEQEMLEKCHFYERFGVAVHSVWRMALAVNPRAAAGGTVRPKATGIGH